MPAVGRGPNLAGTPGKIDDMAKFAGEDLACVRAERLVFERLGFALEPGGALCLTGANGSGKSSLLRLMAGLLKPAHGRLAWDGLALGCNLEGHRARIAFVGHAEALKPALSLAESLAFWARLYGAEEASAAVARGLEAFGLAKLADFPVRLLSAGQRRRLALARLLAGPADLWLLDEPSTGLDAASVAMLEAAIAAFRGDGGMVALATHGGVKVPGAAALKLDKFAPALDGAAFAGWGDL
ncbi:MAG: heme ABC exporter ATP-binding protein CcmA [Alphaproteobacteria bacterium]